MRSRNRTMSVAVLAALATPSVLPGCSAADACPMNTYAVNDGDAAVAFDGSYEVATGPAATIALLGCGGPGYAASFTVGTQTFELTLDTGSAMLAVASSNCTGCSVSPEYTPGPNAHDTGHPAKGVYLQGNWQGEVYSDSVQLAGTPKATPMNIAAIDAQSAFFDNTGCGLGTVPFAPQGIVGLGPSNLASAGTDAFVTKLAALGASRNLFAFEFCAMGGGQLMIGGIDPASAALTGPARYTPMTNSRYYGVTVEDLQLQGESLGFGAPDFGGAAIDTGTSVLTLPPPIFLALSTKIESLPAFSAAFGGRTEWLGTTMCFPSTMTKDQLDAQLPPLTLTFPDGNGGTFGLKMKPTQSYIPPTLSGGTTFYCSGLFQTPATTTGTVFGTSTMLGNLVIFDIDGHRIGFAPQSYCP